MTSHINEAFSLNSQPSQHKDSAQKADFYQFF